MALLVLTFFVVGYTAISIESIIKVSKSAVALTLGVLCWTVYMVASPDKNPITQQLLEKTSSCASIVFFIMGAMTIVSLVDGHNGFDFLVSKINVTSKRKLLWVIGIVTFLLSSVLDNLTTTIVMISLLSKFGLEKQERMLFIGIIVIAANAGGCWTPIGDVTTTMLWIGGQVTTAHIMYKLIIPSLINLVLPMAVLTPFIKGKLTADKKIETLSKSQIFERNLIFILGMLGLLFVPVFKALTDLPPFMGILLVVGVLWLITEILHSGKNETDKHRLSVAGAIGRIDMGSVLFFLGILTSIAALETTGVLGKMAQWMDITFHNSSVIAFMIGIVSAVIDNVPLVAGAMGMYHMSEFAQNHSFWIFLSYCAGTGGSCLIIGSAAGVAAMGLGKIDFIWYLKRITPLATLGYVGGAVIYLLQANILH